MSDTAKVKGRKRSWLIPVILIIVLAACCAAGYIYWRTTHASAEKTADAAKVLPPAAPVFFALDTFTVNLVNPDNDPDRVLYIGLTLRLPDEATRGRLNAYLPEIRSRLLLLLSRQNAAALASEEGKQALIAQIKQTLAPPLVSGQPPQIISDVLFTAFILR